MRWSGWRAGSTDTIHGQITPHGLARYRTLPYKDNAKTDFMNRGIAEGTYISYGEVLLGAEQKYTATVAAIQPRSHTCTCLLAMPVKSELGGNISPSSTENNGE